MSEKELARVFSVEAYENNEFLLKKLIQEYSLPENEDLFLAFRTNKIVIYYTGRVLIECISQSKTWKIIPRKLSTSRSEENIEINNRYIEKLSSIGFADTKSGKIISKPISSDIDYRRLIKYTKSFLDEYNNINQDAELPIEGQYMSGYKKNLDMLSIDAEFTQKFQNKGQKENSPINGRYDMLMLKKVGILYKIVFVELKCKIEQIIDLNTGVINHIFDLNDYLAELKSEKKYLNDKSIIKVLKSNIEFAINMKMKMGLLPSLDCSLIDYSNPELFILYDMVDATAVNSKKKVWSLFERELNYANSGMATYNSMKFDKNGKRKGSTFFKKITRKPLNINGKLVLKSDLSIEDVNRVVEKNKIKFYSKGFQEIC